jgi:PAS domain S-box-containing protein
MALGADDLSRGTKTERIRPVAGVNLPEGQPGRAFGFTQRVASSRPSGDVTPSAAASFEANLETLLDLAVPDFGDWCAIDVVDEEGGAHQFAIRHGGCSREAVNAHECTRELDARVPDLAAIRQRVLGTGQSEVWPLAHDGVHPWCIVVSLLVNDHVFGAITFATDEGGVGYGQAEIAAAEQVAWYTSTAIERVLLHRDARDAVRQTQRIASQLHQLIAASITVAGLRSEEEILANLVTSTRNVFDADAAVVSLDVGPFAPLHVIALRGQNATFIDQENHEQLSDLPRSRPKSSAPWRQDEWLAAPLLERRQSRGLVAMRRTSGSAFGTEDKEVLTLLAQVASRALDAAELSRTIQNSEARWRVLVDTAPVGIVEVEPTGHVHWWNRAASRVFAWSEFALTPGDVRPTFPEAALDPLRTLWSDVLGGAVASGRDFVDIEIGGRRRDLTASAALLPSVEGEERSILTLVDDVTDQRELKAELRHAHRMEIRGQVASSVAHDFNNLLTLISGYAEILSQNLEADGSALEMVRDIQATTSRASMLTAQLQTIGRTKAPEPVVLDPVAAIESNAEVLERIVGVGVELHWALDVDNANVRVDADQFEQMILNLALNARDAMPNGGNLNIAVNSIDLDDQSSGEWRLVPGAYVMISVADNGVGMDQETRQHCFDPLFTTKGPFKGTGLGLAAARRLVEQSGGAIRCQSEVGLGTTFEIVLPAVAERVTEEPASPDVARPRGSATVLLAEDDEGLRRMMVQVLRRNGYQVLDSESGESALAAFASFDGTIDLLVTDVVMGEVSGPELAERLQRAAADLRVLIVSGTADETVLENLRPRSCAFLAKPFKPSQLVDHVHELLSRRT